MSIGRATESDPHLQRGYTTDVLEGVRNILGQGVHVPNADCIDIDYSRRYQLVDWMLPPIDCARKLAASVSERVGACRDRGFDCVRRFSWRRECSSLRWTHGDPIPADMSEKIEGFKAPERRRSEGQNRLVDIGLVGVEIGAQSVALCRFFQASSEYGLTSANCRCTSGRAFAATLCSNR